jgi:hypothetical protein
MAVKAELFDYLPTQIETIVYADCDIIFGLAGCPADYVEAGPGWEEARMKFNRVYYKASQTALEYQKSGNLVPVAQDSLLKGLISTTREAYSGVSNSTGDVTPVGIHCGTFVAHRERSKYAMELWSKELQTLENAGDNYAYEKAYRSLQQEMIRRNIMPIPATDSQQRSRGTPSLRTYVDGQFRDSTATSKVVTEYLMTLTDEEFKSKYLLTNGRQSVLEPGEIFRNARGDKYEKFFDPALNNTCMLHISKARCTAFGRSVVQQAVDPFELRTYSRHPDDIQVVDGLPYSYCPHQWLQPLLYGWFPFSWFPTCPKIETML